MPRSSPTAEQSAVDRRRFLGGVWRTDPAVAPDMPDSAVPPEAGAGVLTVLVQAAPAYLDSVADAIGTIAGIRLLTCDPPGRMTAEVPVDAVAGALCALTALPGVLTASVMAGSGREATP